MAAPWDVVGAARIADPTGPALSREREAYGFPRPQNNVIGRACKVSSKWLQ